MTYEESKNLWELEKLSFEEAKKNGNVTYGLNELYHIVDKLINDNKLKYDEFCYDMSRELMQAGDGEPTEVMNTAIINLTDKYNGR